MVRGYALLSRIKVFLPSYSSHPPLFTPRHESRTKRETDYRYFPRFQIYTLSRYSLNTLFLDSDFTGCEICKSRLAYRSNGSLFGKARKAAALPSSRPAGLNEFVLRGPYTCLCLSTYLLLEPQKI